MPEGLLCPDCGSPNPPEARYCTGCGHRLASACTDCGEDLSPSARFCSSCGAAVADPRATPALAPARARGANGDGAPARMATPGPRPTSLPEERRAVTVLFADLSGFTAACEGVDPELVKSIVGRGLRRLGEEITRHGGHIDKFIGDSVMGVFGAPIAHDDDPERAVRAGLAMQRAMEEIDWSPPEGQTSGFGLRVGINSGEVLAGPMGEGYTVIGSVVNVASRLEAACAPGEVTVGEATWRRTREAISYRRLEPVTAKGMSTPIVAFEATEATEAPAPAAEIPPLIGRRRELELLHAAVRAAADDERAHLTTVIGPAGIGKTRLFEELRKQITAGESGPGVVCGRCPAYGLAPAFSAFADVLRHRLELPQAGDERAWCRLLAGVEELFAGDPGDEPAGLIAARLALPLGIEVPEQARQHPEPGDDPQVRDRMFSAFRAVLERMARARPLLVGIEDVQWADEDTLDLIDHLSRWTRAPVILVCMAREELLDRRPHWGGGKRATTTIRLESLEPGDAAALVSGLLADLDAGDELPTRVADRSDGNPLFAEEMVKRLLEQGADAIAELPDTVQAVLAARLDSLRSDERRLLHHASVAGERFWPGALAALAGEEGIELETTLRALLDTDLVTELSTTTIPGEPEYAFRHALIQEVAYGRLPKAERARRHSEIAAWIETRKPDAVPAEIVGRHYARARIVGEEAALGAEFLRAAAADTLRSLEAAGDAAAAAHSNREALDHYRGALDLGAPEAGARMRIAEKLGDIALRAGRTEEAIEAWEGCIEQAEAEAVRSSQTLARLRRKLGTARWQGGEREQALDQFRRGIELIKGEPPSRELVRLYADAATLYMHTGENMLAIYAAEKSLRAAEELTEPGAASRAYGIFGRVFGRIGDHERARENLERGVERARESDPAETVRALLTLGSHLEAADHDLDRAAESYREALRLARELGDVPAQAELHGGIARLALRRGDKATVVDSTAAGEALVTREGLVGLSCLSQLTRGWLQWCDGEPEAERTLHAAAAEARRVSRLDVAFAALMLAGWALSGAGRHAEADEALSSALDLCERTGLISQSIEATAARAINLARQESLDDARRLAAEAMSIAERFDSDQTVAAALEARGATEADPREGAALLARATSTFAARGRPLAASRARALAGWRLLEVDAGAGRRELAEAAERADELGAHSLARHAREIADLDAPG